jgi:hypothetical protein
MNQNKPQQQLQAELDFAAEAFRSALKEHETVLTSRPFSARDFLLGAAFITAAVVEHDPDGAIELDTLQDQAELIFERMITTSGNLFEQQWDVDDARDAYNQSRKISKP